MSTQHRIVLNPNSPLRKRDCLTESGPISILPTRNEKYEEIIQLCGGHVCPISKSTKGLIWLNLDGAALEKTLNDNPQIQWVQLPWAGVDAFTSVFKRYHEKLEHDNSTPRVVFTSAKGAYAQPVAEHALTLTLASMRILKERCLATQWDTGIARGESLYRRCVVIVGAGGIAVELLNLLKPFRCHCIVVRKQGDIKMDDAAHTLGFEQLHDALGQADVLVLAAALTDQTRGLIGKEQFMLMKPSAVIVNIGRGKLIKTDDLLEALNENRVAAAGVDVTDPEPLPAGHALWTHPRAIVTPHSADTPSMCEPLLGERIRRNCLAFLSGGEEIPFEGEVDPKLGY